MVQPDPCFQQCFEVGSGLGGLLVLVGAASHLGKVRDTNEDAYYVSENIFAVADGMGGHNAGEVASRMAIDGLLAGLDSLEGMPDTLVDAFQAANLTVFNGAQEPGRYGMGTTLTCAVVKDNSVYVAHVGDSRAYLLRDGQVLSLSVDHSVVGELVRSGNLSEQEAKVHPHRHFLTRALGTEQNIPVDLQFRTLQPNDKILLCTDGLTNAVDIDEILNIVQGTQEPQKAVDQLVDLANSRGGQDNITVILVLV